MDTSGDVEEEFDVPEEVEGTIEELSEFLQDKVW